MREIKFRARSDDDVKWCYFTLFGDTALVDGNYHMGEGCAIDENTVCQFTGLKDKNDKEIYEGDIVKLDGEGSLTEVRYRDGQFEVEQVEFRNVMGDAWVSIRVEKNGLEIIGNIYENPELLK